MSDAQSNGVDDGDRSISKKRNIYKNHGLKRRHLPPVMGNHIKCLQVCCAVSNLVLFAFGIFLTVVGSYYFMNFNDVLAGIPNINDGQYMTFSYAMIPFYTMLIMGVLLTVIGFSGCCGAAYLDTCYLNFYIFMLTVLIAGFIAVYIYNVQEKEKFDKAMNTLFSEFEINVYGLDRSSLVVILFVTLLEGMHRSHECCGFSDHAVNITDAYRTVLYWMENTHWGQLSARDELFKSTSHVHWVPASCCVKQEGCDTKRYMYRDRLSWNDSLEHYWVDTIHVDSCKDKALHMADVSNEYKFVYIGTLVTCFVLVFILWILGITFTCEVKRYERKRKKHFQDLKDGKLASPAAKPASPVQKRAAPRPQPQQQFYPADMAGLNQYPYIQPQFGGAQYAGYVGGGSPPSPASGSSRSGSRRSSSVRSSRSSRKR